MSGYIAFDLGADSGRAMVGTLAGDRLTLDEVHRFPNGPVRVRVREREHLYWDVLRLFDEIGNGLRAAPRARGSEIVSVGVDTWGVDYALLDRDDHLIANPYCYRDARIEGVMDKAIARAGRWEIFEQSGGIQFLSLNTLYQLYAMVLENSAQLECARTFLMMPDLFHFWLSGVKACEFTDATTTQFYNAVSKSWATRLLNTLSIPTAIFPEVVPSGTILGKLLPGVADDLGLGEVQVITPAAHDTASAALAVPAENEDCAWLSSGTWSLLGTFARAPMVTPQALEYNFSSFGGAGGVLLPWKNIMGLWLVNECRRVWARRGDELTFDDLTQLAAQAKPFTAVLDPDHPSFLVPADMPAAIQQYCRDTGQAVPQSKGEIVRTALEGLALRYRWTIERLAQLVNKQFKVLHIVGGGSKNRLLCQFSADVTGLPVIAGPVEATAIGNLAQQAVALGHLRDLGEARQLIRRSFDVATFEPGAREAWDAAYEKFQQLVG